MLGLGQQVRPFHSVKVGIGTGLELEHHRVPPSSKLICPCLDRIFIATSRVRGEGSSPPVVGSKAHGFRAPFPVGFPTPNQCGGYYVVPVTINIRPHLDGLSDDSFNGVATAVD